MTSLAVTVDGLRERLLSASKQTLKSYQVHDHQGMVRLDAMESPYNWTVELWQKFLAHLALQQDDPAQAPLAVNRYPDPQARTLKQALWQRWQAEAEQDGWNQLPSEANAAMVLGNGSDELIQLLTLMVSRHDKRVTVLAPEPSFVMYRQCALVCGCDYVGVPLHGPDSDSPWQLNLSAMLQAIREQQPAIVFLTYPNNPTGNAWSLDDLRQIVDVAPGLVVFDETYYPYCGQSQAKWTMINPKVMVLRTLSKIGMAGLRVGYLLCHPDWQNTLEAFRMPYNLGTFSQQAAAFVLNQWHFVAENIDKILQQRTAMQQALWQLPPSCGVTSFDTSANFILLRVANAALVWQQLQAQGLLVKNLDAAHPLLKNCLRINVDSATNNQRVLGVLSKLAG